ncbi:hypothetical protein KW805_00415 [Candidatus Pacearchaeota archaeon]|nr:hypothetical protein [Candidatus Pacearchaeota archaeon]
MAGTSNIYGGGYSLESNYSDYSVGNMNYKVPVSQFGAPSDPRTANQLQAVSQKLNTGLKTIEVSAVALGGEAMSLIDQIPKQQFQEINRLKKLTGVDLTFHGPLVEATGFAGRQGWSEMDREQAERQMFSAVERGQKLDPDGNIVITFHSSNGLPEPVTEVINEQGKKEITSVWLIDERDGKFAQIKPKESYWEGKKYDEPGKINELIQKHNQSEWEEQLQRVNYNLLQGTNLIDNALNLDKVQNRIEKPELLNYYKTYTENAEEGDKRIQRLGEFAPVIKDKLREITQGQIALSNTYSAFQNLYDDAYYAAQKSKSTDDQKKLDALRAEISPKLHNIKDPDKIPELADALLRGINVLKSIEPPKILRPLHDFAIDKASETFSNVAYKSYKEFKEKAPIISIENPPAGGGQSGLSRAEDLRRLVDESRKKFAEKAMKEGMSKSDAEFQAEKLIGVTWDVGHINMIRKYGYSEKDVIKESEKIGDYVKHVHLSDNFGLEHTELPMGMGNVPTKEILQLNEKYKQAKKIIETGGWFKDFKITPFNETLRAFNSPIYGMQMAPSWGTAAGRQGGYFAGYGTFLPEQHFSMYGSGFANLPVELGGQMSGRNRLSGAPIE